MMFQLIEIQVEKAPIHRVKAEEKEKMDRTMKGEFEKKWKSEQKKPAGCKNAEKQNDPANA